MSAKTTQAKQRKDITAADRKEKRFDVFWLCGIVISTTIYIFHSRSSYKVIYLNNLIPFLPFALGALLGLVLVYFIRKYLFSIEITPRTFFTSFTVNAKNFFFAVVVVGPLMSILFYEINAAAAEKETPALEKSKVWRINLQGSGSHNSIDFYFQGADKSFSNFASDATIRRAVKEKEYGRYYMLITYKKGLYSSFIVKNWQFVID